MLIVNQRKDIAYYLFKFIRKFFKNFRFSKLKLITEIWCTTYFLIIKHFYAYKKNKKLKKSYFAQFQF